MCIHFDRHMISSKHHFNRVHNFRFIIKTLKLLFKTSLNDTYLMKCNTITVTNINKDDRGFSLSSSSLIFIIKQSIFLCNILHKTSLNCLNSANISQISRQINWIQDSYLLIVNYGALPFFFWNLNTATHSSTYYNY